MHVNKEELQAQFKSQLQQLKIDRAEQFTEKSLNQDSVIFVNAILRSLVAEEIRLARKGVDVEYVIKRRRRNKTNLHEISNVGITELGWSVVEDWFKDQNSFKESKPRIMRINELGYEVIHNSLQFFPRREGQ